MAQDLVIGGIITATSAGKIPWCLHHDGNGYWANMPDSFRMDLIDGTFTLVKGPQKLDEVTDDGSLLAAIEAYSTSKKSEDLASLAGMLT